MPPCVRRRNFSGSCTYKVSSPSRLAQLLLLGDVCDFVRPLVPLELSEVSYLVLENKTVKWDCACYEV